MGEQKAREAKIASAINSGHVCGNCKYGMDSGMPNVITCRRYPPMPLPTTMVMTPDAKSGGGTSQAVNVGSHFPNMAADGWCGEYGTRLILN